MWIKEPTFRVLSFNGGWATATESVFKYRDHTFVIPEDFQTDFATVPRILKPLIPTDGKYRLPAVIHDYLYVCHVANGALPRILADEIFYEDMISKKVRPFTAKVMYTVVRLLGRFYLKQYQK